MPEIFIPNQNPVIRANAPVSSTPLTSCRNRPVSREVRVGGALPVLWPKGEIYLRKGE
jgi:hypothetical protein